MKRWINRPEGSNWGEFGENDQIGRLNLLTPDRRLAAVREVREGLAFILTLPLDYPRKGLSPTRKPPRLQTTSGHNCQLSAQHRDVFCDDAVEITLQYSTQWDAFSHFGALFDADGDGVAEPVYYNGYRAGEHILADDGGAPRAAALGIESIAETGVQGRGVMVDLSEQKGRPALIGYDALMRLFDDQKVVVEAGDIVCFYTGLSDIILREGDALNLEEVLPACPALDGHDARLLDWITRSEVVALASDNAGVEAAFPDPSASGDLLYPLHYHCLFKLGMPLGEFWHLSELAAWLKTHGRSRFLLTAPPLRLPGAVGSPVSGVATV
jgi:kynurenine formamidase